MKYFIIILSIELFLQIMPKYINAFFQGRAGQGVFYSEEAF